jgi:GNAT superfamily N-acetyltransferase
MLTNTVIVIGAEEQISGRLVAFVRVLTDGVFRALIFDVIVAPDFRNRGLGTKLMETIREHPQLRDVRHLELYCLPEMAPFYERWGFSSNLGGLVLIQSEHRQTTQ